MQRWKPARWVSVNEPNVVGAGTRDSGKEQCLIYCRWSVFQPCPLLLIPDTVILSRLFQGHFYVRIGNCSLSSFPKTEILGYCFQQLNNVKQIGTTPTMCYIHCLQTFQFTHKAHQMELFFSGTHMWAVCTLIRNIWTSPDIIIPSTEYLSMSIGCLCVLISNFPRKCWTRIWQGMVFTFVIAPWNNSSTTKSK